jgi:hypothetical protein
MPKPRLSIYLRNGDVLSLRGDLMVAESGDTKTVAGLPEIYVELVRSLRAAGLRSWSGPREESIAASTCAAMGIVVAVLAWMVAQATYHASSETAVAIAITLGVVFANLAFPLSRLVGPRIRREYLKGLLMQ